MKLALFITLLSVVMTLPAQAQGQPAKELFGAKSDGSDQYSRAYGSYAKGCLAGGEQLAETGSSWQAMRLSRNRNWAHPSTVDFVQRLAHDAKRIGWNGLYIGDMSQPRGGPMLTGHRSHQVGLDVDIWMLPPTDLSLSKKERENLSSISMRRDGGAFVNNKWTPQHHAIIRAAAKDRDVARIFVFPGAKVQMCKDEKGDRSWLRKVRPWYGHHYHFHVRLSCPRGTRACVNQAPPPPGDGCAVAQSWVNDILNPGPPKPAKPPGRARRELTLTDLPRECAKVLSSS